MKKAVFFRPGTSSGRAFTALKVLVLNCEKLETNLVYYNVKYAELIMDIYMNMCYTMTGTLKEDRQCIEK